jgi:hypothetical protein
VDFLGANTSEPLVLFTTLLLSPPKHTSTHAAFVAQLVHFLKGNLSQEIDHFQAVTVASTCMSTRCSLLFTASLRLLQQQRYPTDATAFLVGVWDRCLRDLRDSGLRRELAVYVRDHHGECGPLASLLRHADSDAAKLDVGKRRTTVLDRFPAAVITHWLGAETTTPTAAGTILLSTLPLGAKLVAALRVLPAALVVLDTPLPQHVPPDLRWQFGRLQQSSGISWAPHGGWQPSAQRLALGRLARLAHPGSGDAGAALKLLQMLLLFTLDGRQATAWHVRQNLLACRAFCLSPHARALVAQTQTPRTSERKRRTGSQARDELRAHTQLQGSALLSLLVDLAVSGRTPSAWKLHGVVAAPFASQLDSGLPSAGNAINLFAVVWKLAPVLAVQHNMAFVRRSAVQLASAAESSDGVPNEVVLAYMAVCQRLVASVCIDVASNTAPELVRSAQLVLSRLVSTLEQLAQRRGLFDRVVAFLNDGVFANKRDDAYVLRHNAQWSLSADFIKHLASRATAPSDEADHTAVSNTWSLLGTLVAFPTVWQEHVVRALRLTPALSGLVRGPTFVAFLEALLTTRDPSVVALDHDLVNVLFSEGTTAWLVGTAAGVDNAVNPSVRSSARQVCAKLISVCVAQQREACQQLALFRAQLRTRFPSIAGDVAYYTLLPTLDILLRPNITAHRPELLRQFGFASTGAVIAACVTNLVAMLRTRPWATMLFANTAESQLWDLLHAALSIASLDPTTEDLAEAVGSMLLKQFVARALRRRYERFHAHGTTLAAILKICKLEGIPRHEFEGVVTLLATHDSFIHVLRGTGKVSDDLVDLLHFLVPRCPIVVKKRPRLAYVFLAAYSASMCSRDQKLLDLIELFDTCQCQLSASTIGYRWGAAVLGVNQAAHLNADGVNQVDGALSASPADDISWVFVGSEAAHLGNDSGPVHAAGLDEARIWSTLANFPRDRICTATAAAVVSEGHLTSVVGGDSSASSLYDPRFLLRLFLHYAQRTVLPLRQFVQWGCLAVVVFATSSPHQQTRALSYRILALVADQLATATFPEAMQLRYLAADLLRRSSATPFAQVPCLVCSFVAEACQIFLDPASELFAPLNRFLLQRPFLDFTDVPMFYACFQAGTPDVREVSMYLGLRSFLCCCVASGMSMLSCGLCVIASNY